MLDTSESRTLTDSFRSLVVDGPRSTSHGSKMVPRRLLLGVKIVMVVIAVTIVLIIVTAFTKRNNIFSVANPENDQNSVDETLPDGLRVGDMYYDRFTHSLVFKKMLDDKPYVTLAFKHNNYLKSANMKSSTGCGNSFLNGGKRVLCLEFDDIRVGAYAEKDCHVVHVEIRDVFELKKREDSVVVQQCIDMQENWYGGGALSEHRWPLNRVNVHMQPYVTKKLNQSSHVHFESFLEPYFVSATGTAIVFDPFLPLFVSMNAYNDKKLCFKAVFDDPYTLDKNDVGHTLLKYTVCKDRIAKDVHKRLLQSRTLNRPLSTPNMDVLQKPLWSTRGFNLNKINEMETLAYISNLKKSHLNFSQLVIDGNYSRSSGSVYFDEKKFPHSAQLAMELDSKLPHENLKLATEVFPLLPKFMAAQNFSYPSLKPGHNFSEGKDENLLLDVSNKQAVDWFIAQLNTIITQVKVKGFRFSGGQAALVINRTQTVLTNHSTGRVMHPNRFTQEYCKIAGKFQGNSLLSSGYRSQDIGLVSDAGPFLASWTHQKGLKSVIPTIVTYGIMGYPFVSAGPIGGIDSRLNASSGHFYLSDRNLYLRWLQLATFLPVMEFSVGPWQYDAHVVNITRGLIGYRQNEIWPKYLLPAIKETTETGIPVIRPLWWVAPKDKTAQFIDCEFLVGDDLLVAPVLEKGAVGRQVYLPFGSVWRDVLRGGKTYEGGQWLRDYRVEEFEIAHFVRMPAAANSKS